MTNTSIRKIGQTQRLCEILINSFSTRQEIINETTLCYSGEDYLDNNWSKRIAAWGNSPERITPQGIFSEQYTQLAQLNLDWGIIVHLPEFLDFLKIHYTCNKPLLRIREEFKDSLGYDTLFRGISLNEEELEKIKQFGIESQLLRRIGESENSAELFEREILNKRVNNLIEDHFHRASHYSPLISVSSHEDVAIAVGRAFGRSIDLRKKLYLFKIKIPKIDRIYYTAHGFRSPAIFEGHMGQLTIKVNGEESKYPWDMDVESYIGYKINPSEILEISKPEILASSWNGRVY